MSLSKPRLERIERSLAAEVEIRALEKPSGLSTSADKLWADYWWAEGNLTDIIAPRSAFDPEPVPVSREALHECAHQAGATYLRCFAALLKIGADGPDDIAAGETEELRRGLVNDLLADAAALDARGVPDLSRHWYDAARLDFDAAGRFVHDSLTTWTWRDRLAAAQRFEQRYRLPFYHGEAGHAFTV